MLNLYVTKNISGQTNKIMLEIQYSKRTTIKCTDIIKTIKKKTKSMRQKNGNQSYMKYQMLKINNRKTQDEEY